jgi:hypothetical protein
MEKYIKKLKFIEEHMITSNALKQDFYDIIVENRPIKIIKREEDDDKYGNFGIEVIINPSNTMTYYYKKREHRDSDFEEVSKFKELYNGQLGRY